MTLTDAGQTFAERARVVLPRDLEKHACLLLAGPTTSPFWHFDGASTDGTKATIRVQGPFRANNTLSLYEAAKAGLGIAELPRYLVADDLRARRLVAVLEPHAPEGRGVYVLYPQTRFLPARVRVLIDHLVPALEDALGDL